MKSDQLKKYALIAEIVGGIAVVISVIFLTIEVRSNTEAQKLVAAQQVLGLSSVINSDIAINGNDLTDLMFRIGSGEIESKDRARFTFYQSSVFAAFWQVHYQYTNGFLEEEIFRAYERRIIDQFQQPSVQDYWDRNKFRFSDSFQSYVDSIKD